jgi:hypothetical protein
MVDSVPYPRFAPGFAPGSNGIGGFAIGVSPIGELSPYDPWVTVISQYANSSAICSMVSSFNAAMDQTQIIENVYDMIWNVYTAQGYGLDVWGRIVGVGRALRFSGGIDYLGMNEAGLLAWTGFEQGILYSGGTTTNNVNLSDTDFRTLILAKAASNICDGSIPAINAILLNLFGNGHVQDNQDMTMAFVFTVSLTPVQQAIIAQSGVLPNPAGVVITVVQP